MPEGDAELLDSVIKKAGELALGMIESGARSWDKADGTPVTEIDLAVDTFLKQSLCETRPDYGWLSEETVDDPSRLQCKHVWIADPIDGTRALIEGTDEWCISVALVEAGRPVTARIFQPVAGKLYEASLNGGATLNGKPLRLPMEATSQPMRLIARGRIFNERRWSRPWKPLPDTGMVASLALRLCNVADGQYDGMIALGSKCEWDLAAGDLIVREAGGMVSDLNGDAFSYNNADPRKNPGVMAGRFKVHKKMRKQMQYFIR